MGKVTYSLEVCRDLLRRARDAALHCPHRLERYEPGDVLDLAFTTVWPEASGRGRFRVLKFAGGGFAGQVYPCVVEALDVPPHAAGALRVGATVAVKIMLPASRCARAFRDALYWLGFQGSFSAQVNAAACRAGLLWQKLVRAAAAVELGRADAVADVYASFHDGELGAWGEIREWVEGRTWLLEADTRLAQRRKWRTLDLARTASPEYVAKRRFMHRFVALLHELGAVELARQYEWWTMKSQPNVLKRAGASGPDGGLCAVDFRAGLVLLPFLPMSPADIVLILRGLARGALVQFDRADFRQLAAFVESRGAAGPGLRAMAAALEPLDRAYRRSLPDLFRQGWRLPFDRALRADVRRGLAEGYAATGLADAAFAARLAASPLRFAAFYALGALPFAGRTLRRWWGHAAWRAHRRACLTSRAYLARALRAGAAARLVRWLRAGRVGDARAAWLADHAWAFWLQRATLGCLPAGLHRALAEPSHLWGRLAAWCGFARRFLRDDAFREQWFVEQVHRGREEGMLDDAERDAILARVRDPFIVRYLKSLGVHVATLPVSELFWTIAGGGVAAWAHLTGRDAAACLGALAAFAVAFPLSPGSIVRSLYVVGLMIRERNVRDYVIAAPFSALKIVGYLAFPIQMVAVYPALARFMASRWATETVRCVPVFGEKGALLEHLVFDACFNIPHRVGLWASKRLRGLLTVWLLLGLLIAGVAFVWMGVDWHSRKGVEIGLLVLCVFLLPRLLFYPLLARRPRPKACTERNG